VPRSALAPCVALHGRATGAAIDGGTACRSTGSATAQARLSLVGRALGRKPRRRRRRRRRRRHRGLARPARPL